MGFRSVIGGFTEVLKRFRPFKWDLIRFKGFEGISGAIQEFKAGLVSISRVLWGISRFL